MSEDGGTITVAHTAAAGLVLVVVVALANSLVVAYGRGVVRAALDEGVRAASRAGTGVADCHQRAQQTIDDLLGGAMGSGVQVTCAVGDTVATAAADVVWPSWLPGVPDWSFGVAAAAVREQPP